MFQKQFTLFLGVMIVLSMVMSACGGGTATQPPATGPAVATEKPTATGPQYYHGGWMDEIDFSVVSADTAVTQLKANAIDLYITTLARPVDMQAIKDANLERSSQYGTFYGLLLNPVLFTDTNVLNPFSDVELRQAMNWLVDRNYINQEIYGGNSLPKWVAITNGFPDYARYIEVCRAIEAKYAYNLQKAQEVIDARMSAMNATKVDGKWQYKGKPVWLNFVIRSDADQTRRPLGDYVANQLESSGFTVNRMYKTSTEASPIWLRSDPAEGQWHLYTEAWGVTSLQRDQGNSFQFNDTPESSYGFSPLWQAYTPSPEYDAIATKLANNDFTSLQERANLFKQALQDSMDLAYHIWLIDGKGASAWQPGYTVTYDLGAGIDTIRLWPYTMRRVDQDGNTVQGGIIRIGQSDLYVDPWNPIGGSNWTVDWTVKNPTTDAPVISDPFTGLSWPQRIESAKLYLQNGTPVAETNPWAELQFVDQNIVPADAWADWDAVNQKFIPVSEKFPSGATAKAKVVVTYPADLFKTVKWHDGSPLTLADFIMTWIMTFDPSKPESAIYDESRVSNFEAFMQTFKGLRIASQDPLVIEYYTDTWYMDADYNVANAYTFVFWPNSSYGDAPWHSISIGNLAEAAKTLAYTTDKADALGVDWTNFIGGPSLELLGNYLDQALAEKLVPYAPTLGAYITADEAAARYANLKSWCQAHQNFWVGTGPYYLEKALLVEKTATLKSNPLYVDPQDKWMRFSEPRIPDAEIVASGDVSVGKAADFDVNVTFKGQPYPTGDIQEVKYLLFDSTGIIISSGAASAVSDGQYRVSLSGAETAKLQTGSAKLEVVVLAIPVALPTLVDYIISVK